MTTSNDITGSLIKSRPTNSAYEEGWERIFGEKDKSSNEEDRELIVETEENEL